LMTVEYVITEKIHGVNFQFCAFPDGLIKMASRNNWLDEDTFLNTDLCKIRKDNEIILRQIQQFAEDNNEIVRLYGELFGDGIQRGVDYGPVKRIKYFGMKVGDSWTSFSYLRTFLDNYYIVPIIGVASGLDNALEFNPSGDTRLGNGIREGIVIQPYNKVYVNHNGNMFILKNKSDEFQDHKAITKSSPQEIDLDVVRLRDIFTTYINNNRIQSIFSKHNIIKRRDQIGDYIRLIIADALEDFVEDYPEYNNMNKKSCGQITNVGGKIARLLDGYIE